MEKVLRCCHNSVFLTISWAAFIKPLKCGRRNFSQMTVDLRKTSNKPKII